MTEYKTKNTSFVICCPDCNENMFRVTIDLNQKHMCHLVQSETKSIDVTSETEDEDVDVKDTTPRNKSDSHVINMTPINKNRSIIVPEATLPFGKYKGKSLREVVATAEGYQWLKWAAHNVDFRGDDLKTKVKTAVSLYQHVYPGST